MDAVNILLDKARATCSTANDKGLADALRVGQSAVSNWRHGRAYPDAVACARIAEMTGEPLARVLGIVGEARALSSAEKAVWHRLAAAAAVAGVALLSLYHSDAGGLVHFAIIPGLSIMSATVFISLNCYFRDRTILDRENYGRMLAL